MLVLFDTKIYLDYFNCILTTGVSLEGIFVGICCGDEDWFWFWDWDEDWLWDWDVDEFYWVDIFLLSAEFEGIYDEFEAVLEAVYEVVLEKVLEFEEIVELMELDKLFPELVVFKDIVVEFPVFVVLEEFELLIGVCIWLAAFEKTGILLFLVAFNWLELKAEVDEFDTVEVLETVEEFDWFVIVLFKLFILDEGLLIYFISEMTTSKILTS